VLQCSCFYIHKTPRQTDYAEQFHTVTVLTTQATRINWDWLNLQTHSQLVAPNKPTDKSYASLYNW